MNGEIGREVGAAIEIDGDLPVAVERRIEHPIREIAGEGSVGDVTRGVSGPSRRDDAPVGLKGDGECDVRAAEAEVGDDLAAYPEPRVQAPISRIAREGGVVARLADHDEPAVSLKDKVEGDIVRPAKVGRHHAVSVEGRIEGAILRVASEGEVADRSGGPMLVLPATTILPSG